MTSSYVCDTISLNRTLCAKHGHMELRDEIDKLLGFPGRMLSGSKSDYDRLHPTDLTFFNACIFNDKYEQIWWGDINLTKSSPALQEIANKIKSVFYVTREQPYRFDGLTKKDLNNVESVRIFVKE